MSRISRVVRLSGVGLWRFVVGDTPEFALAVAALVVYALLLRHVRPALVVGLPVLVAAALGTSVLAAVGRRRRALRLRSEGAGEARTSAPFPRRGDSPTSRRPSPSP